MAALNLCIFRKNLVVYSLEVSKNLAFVGHCSGNFKPILDCFIPNFKLKYRDSENMNADRVNTPFVNLHKIKRSTFFFCDIR